MNEDIGHLLDSWWYDPEEDIMVRVIRGDDHRPKIQMRIDLGVMQMELDGNPTGDNPEGLESWLEYYEIQQSQYEKSRVDDYFSLSGEDCKKLRREAVHYYYRYLCLMKLEDYSRVVRDTERNLRAFAFVKKYASSEMDRWALDQYRPYVIMMNTRARASLALRQDVESGIVKAVEFFDQGIVKIVGFYKEYSINSELENSMELSILKALKNEFLRISPPSPSYEEELEKAVREERFEDAAILRDKIRQQEEKKESGKKAK
ncbi:MAG: UvrB/UvrC motif-containing protein [Candidatus Latescibacter sp.]|nr:UvrB/UvrC motif-containing protein [Candidatus Latescibacter sp.]